jgi:hypothetical protein
MARSRHFHVYNDGLRSEPFCYRAEARERARLLAGVFGTPGGFLPNIGECCDPACLAVTEADACPVRPSMQCPAVGDDGRPSGDR